MRKIFCTGCNKYLGEIRDAKLLKGIKFLCPKCNTNYVSSGSIASLGDILGIKI